MALQNVASLERYSKSASAVGLCLQSCRLHAGRLASLFGVSAKSEDANGKPKTASNAMVISLRNTPIEPSLYCPCKSSTQRGRGIARVVAIRMSEYVHVATSSCFEDCV